MSVLLLRLLKIIFGFVPSPETEKKLFVPTLMYGSFFVTVFEILGPIESIVLVLLEFKLLQMHGKIINNLQHDTILLPAL